MGYLPEAASESPESPPEIDVMLGIDTSKILYTNVHSCEFDVEWCKLICELPFFLVHMQRINEFLYKEMAIITLFP